MKKNSKLIILIFCGMFLIPALPHYAKGQAPPAPVERPGGDPSARDKEPNREAPQQQTQQVKMDLKDFVSDELSYATPITEKTIPHFKENLAGTTVMGYPEYIIGVSDELTITLWLKSKAEFNKVLVQQNGKISFLFVEDLQAVGLTPAQIDLALTEKLTDYVKNPRLDVLVTGYNSKRVTLTGEIARMNTGSGFSGPGTYKLTDETRLLELILRAGGYSEKADLSHIEVTRGGKVYSVDLNKTLYQGDNDQNIFLEGGDTINVPTLAIFQAEKTATKKVFVLGDVTYPGRYEFKKQISVVEAIALAGGIKNEADDAKTRILRGREVLPINVRDILYNEKTELNIPIQDTDIVFVPKLAIFEEDRLFKKRFYVTGGVTYPKFYEFTKNVGVLEAVAMAGGFTAEAYEAKAFLLREGQKVPVDFPAYLANPEKFKTLEMQDGDVLYVPKQFSISVAVLGEVIQPGQYEIKGENITVSEAIAEARGLTLDAVASDALVMQGDIRKPRVQKVNLEKFFNKQDLTQNILIKEGDVIYIPRSKIANIAHFMEKLAPILANLMYPGLYRDMYSTGGGMRFNSGYPSQSSGSTGFPQVAP